MELSLGTAGITPVQKSSKKCYNAKRKQVRLNLRIANLRADVIYKLTTKDCGLSVRYKPTDRLRRLGSGNIGT